jgi:CheY-like chemotaxis protein
LQAAAGSGAAFDFAIVDYDVPGMGGLGLAEAILDDPATAATQLVLLVPYSHRGWQDEPLLDGIQAVLAKPVRARLLLGAMLECGETARRSDLARLGQSLRRTPVEQAFPLSAAEAGPQPVPLVLIVEDNAVNQKVTVRLVEKAGCRAVVVANGEEALEAMEAAAFDLILMDCQMPAMDGFQATAAIRRLEGDQRRTPIIAMTAYAMHGERERCLAAGMDDYLSKPVSYEDLRAAIQRWLEPGAAEPGAHGPRARQAAR